MCFWEHETWRMTSRDLKSLTELHDICVVSMAGRTQLPCLWPSWRHGLDPKVTWSAVEAAWHHFWKHHKLHKLYKLVLISKFVSLALFSIEGDASDFWTIFQIQDPRYGIMMKRQEFREKAEEIGFVKYRWGTQVSRSEHSIVKMCLVIGTPTTDRRVCSWCRSKRMWLHWLQKAIKMRSLFECSFFVLLPTCWLFWCIGSTWEGPHEHSSKKCGLLRMKYVKDPMMLV